MTTPVIGIAGCGCMGGPMLQALQDAGLNARGFDIRAADSYAELGPYITNDAADFCENLSVVFSVVRDIGQTQDLLFDKQNIISHARNLRTVVISSTVSPNYIKDLRQAIPDHIAIVDAPMSGARIAAQEQRLSFMLGGNAGDIDEISPALHAMGSSFHHMGELGAGMSAKVLNNLLAASNTAMTRLVLDWACAHGLEENRLLGLIEKSSGQNWFASGFDEIEFAREGYGPDNTIAILEKDVLSAIDAMPKGADDSLPRAVISQIKDLQKKTD